MIGSQRKFIAQQKAAIENCLHLCTTYFRLDIQQNKNIFKWPFVYLSNIMNLRIFLALEIKWVTSAICKTLNFTYNCTIEWNYFWRIIPFLTQIHEVILWLFVIYLCILLMRSSNQSRKYKFWNPLTTWT